MLRILLVDDSRSVQAYVKDCFSELKQTQIEFYQSYTGEDALSILKDEVEKSFDLVLLDWEMPGIKGPQVLKKIQEEYTKIPVIMLTSRNNLEDIAYTTELGAVEYIMKPFTKNILLEKMGRILDQELG